MRNVLEQLGTGMIRAAIGPAVVIAAVWAAGIAPEILQAANVLSNLETVAGLR